MLKFLTAKIYELMTDGRDEHPVLRTIVYLAIFHLFLFMCFFLPLQTLFERLGYKIVSSATFVITTIIIATIGILIWLYYFLVKRNNLEKIANKYAGNKLNKNISVLILFFSLFLLFFVGPTLTIFLFGGTISKWDFNGILTPYFPRP